MPHTAQLVCTLKSGQEPADPSVCSDIMSNIDQNAAKAAAKANLSTKYAGNRNWQGRWKTFDVLAAACTYKTS